MTADPRSRGRALALDDELRSCLATIVGYAMLLDSEDPRARQDAPRRIVASIQQLSDALKRRAIEAASAGWDATSDELGIRRVLVIEEDAGARRLLKRMFPADVEVVETDDPDDALQFAGEDVALVVLSWRATGSSPPETLAELKIKYPSLAVLVIADGSDGVYQGVAEVLGADAFLTRPIDSLELLTEVDRLLRDS